VATDLETRLRSLSDELPRSDPAVADRVVSRVVEGMKPPPARPRRELRRGRVAVAVAVGVAAVAAMLVGSFTGGTGRTDPAAAAVLRRAAITAAHQPALPPLEAGQYYHFRDTEIGWVEKAYSPNQFTSCGSACPPPPADWVVKMPVVNDYWITAGGSGLRVPTSGRPTFRSDAVRRSYRRIYGFPLSHPMGIFTRDRFSNGQWAFGWGLTYRQLQQLPSNPSSQASDPTSANPLSYEEFTVIGDIMRDSPLRPRVRAAFYTILSRLPGIEYGGRVTDPLGRPGIEVSMQRSSGEPRDILIFDPHTAQLLSEGDCGYSQWSVVDSIGR
jgi:hypothetical protein